MPQMKSLSLLYFALVFPCFCIAMPAPPEIVELTPKSAKDLGFRIELKADDNQFNFDVEYPQEIEGWDRPKSPEIMVYDKGGKLILETFGNARVIAKIRHSPLRFGFTCDRHHDVSITFWYGGEKHGEASKGFRIRSYKAFLNIK